MATFKKVPENFSFPQMEEKIIGIWNETRAFERSVEQRSDEDAFVFYDGPPFATGLPHYGHFVASTLKDIVPRYWAMRGKRVERRFGWDTHGLPIEMLVEKELGLSGPVSIREYGVDKFNEACRAGVLKYTEEWRKTIGRLGRWVDFDNDYKTMDKSFMETVWWVFGELWKKGRVYQGVRVMPYSWRLSTPLSNFEAGQDYRDVQDPAVTVAMPIDDDADDASLLIWTTTPWTLPSNLAIAVGTDIDYVRARAADDGKVYVVAAALAEKVLGEHDVLATLKGADLVGLGYAPLFDFFAAQKTGEAGGSFVVIASGHVTTDSGTGLVHMAPAYGEDDFAACEKVGIGPVDPVDEEGNFTDVITPWAGQNIKEADKSIIRAIKETGRLKKHDTIVHSYPFCERSGTPLIYKTVPVWFVKVTDQRDRMRAHNAAVHWVPDAIGKGRFDNWLEGARDWAISRNRFWGTPLPIYTCGSCGEHRCVSSADELAALSGETIDDLHPHKIDHLTVPCASCDGTATRVPEVFDCWFESGSMPYAQNHYPFENKDRFEAQFPAQFIAEGLDQTRGWFYTLMVLSTALFDKPPFENVIVNGMVLAEDGSKMSKSKKNYPDPNIVLDQHGADALRAYLINSPVVRADPMRFAEKGVKDVVRTVLLPMKNAWAFFNQYAVLDGWDPKTDLESAPAYAERPEIDRWVLSMLQSLVKEVNTQMEGYYLYKVVPPMLDFIDHLTNWYIRRSRRRFWRAGKSAEGRADKASAYATLYEVLVTFSKVVAPVLPFMAEELYQNLVVEPGCAEDGKDSVHLCDYPEANTALIDAELEAAVDAVRRVVRLGRAVREKHKLKTRQPLPAITVITHDAALGQGLLAHAELVESELNVKALVVKNDDDGLFTLTFKPNFKTLGRRMGKNMKAASAAIAAFGRDELQTLQGGGTIEVCGEAIALADVMVSRTADGALFVESEGELTIALDATLTEELRDEGLMRELLSKLQKLRKDTGLAVEDRVAITWHSDDAALRRVFARFGEHIASEVLATALTETGGGDSMDVDGHALTLTLQKS